MRNVLHFPLSPIRLYLQQELSWQPLFLSISEVRNDSNRASAYRWKQWYDSVHFLTSTNSLVSVLHGPVYCWQPRCSLEAALTFPLDTLYSYCFPSPKSLEHAQWKPDSQNLLFRSAWKTRTPVANSLLLSFARSLGHLNSCLQQGIPVLKCTL